MDATSSRGEGTKWCPKVYYPTHADLYLGIHTPLYLNWIIEDSDGSLYMAPAEEAGWLKRQPYEGPVDKLKPVGPRRARAVAEHLQVRLSPRGTAADLLYQQPAVLGA
jgi:hypothetical protein